MKIFDAIVAASKRFTRPRLRLRFIETEPEAIAPGIIYIVGTPNLQKWAIFACPCGCKDRIELYLGSNRRSRWTVRIERGGPTLRPSIWQTRGCGAHFWVRRGRVDFVQTSTTSLRRKN